jgi:hypothetical protein
MPTERSTNRQRGNAAGWNGGGSSSDLITASEIACFAYCPEQWRLEYGLELLPANGTALKAGTRRHWWKALAEWFATRVIGIGRVLILIAALLLLVLWLTWR